LPLPARPGERGHGHGIQFSDGIDRFRGPRELRLDRMLLQPLRGSDRPRAATDHKARTS